MDQEKEVVTTEDSSVNEFALEENIASLYAETNKDQETELPYLDSKVDANNGDIPEAMKLETVADGSHCEYSGDTSAIRNDNTNDKPENFSNLKCDFNKNELHENLEPQTSRDEGEDNATQNDISSDLMTEKCKDPDKPTECYDISLGNVCNNSIEKSEQNMITTSLNYHSLQSDDSEGEIKTDVDNDDLILKTRKKITEGNWSEGIQEELECVLMQDEKAAGNECCESNALRLQTKNEVISDLYESGSNVVENETEEESIAEGQGVEVMDPKTNDETNDEIKNKHSEKDKSSEDGKDTQRPRSRSYPFKVLVSGLPLGARREEVMCYFSQFGEVLKLWDEGRHRANVLFADEESYKKAVFAPDPYFDDHKLIIRSLNETVGVISGIPRTTPAKVAEKAIQTVLEEAGVAPCRISVPLSDPTEATEGRVIQGHALVAFSDPQTLQKAEEIQNNELFVIADCPVNLHPSCNAFYEKFCIRVFPLPCEKLRSVVHHKLCTTFTSIGEIVAVICQYSGNATAYAGYVLFESEDSVKQAKEMGEVKILDEFVQIQDFSPFDQGQGFRHLWLKIINLPPRITITEIKHHFGHDRGILNIELDLDFGSCSMHVNSEETIQRCFQMHQTYLRGKCIAVLIAEDNPDRVYYREISRRGRRPNFRNSTGRKKSLANNASTGFNGKTFTSATQPQGNQDRRGFERGDRKFSKSRTNVSHPKEVPKAVKEDGDGVKIADSPAV